MGIHDKERQSYGDFSNYDQRNVTLSVNSIDDIRDLFTNFSHDAPILLHSFEESALPDTVHAIEVGIFPEEPSSLFGYLPQSIQACLTLDKPLPPTWLSYLQRELADFLHNDLGYGANVLASQTFNGTTLAEIALKEDMSITLAARDSQLLIWSAAQKDSNLVAIESNDQILENFFHSTAHVLNKLATTSASSHSEAHRTHLLIEKPDDDPYIPPEHDFSHALEKIGGHQRVKERLREIGALYQFPELAKQHGVLPTHFLLYGPEGTGKSTIVEEFADGYDMTLLTYESSDLVDSHIGQSSKNIKEMFEKAIKESEIRPVVLFVNEIDSIIVPKNASNHSENTSAINTFKTCMDNINDPVNGLRVILAGATNADPSTFERALVRTGRLEPIPVNFPSLQELQSIWFVKLHDEFPDGFIADTEVDLSGDDYDLESLVLKDSSRHDDDARHTIDYSLLAEHTKGRSGADIAGIINEIRNSRFLTAAALAQTVKKNGQHSATPITMREILAAIDKFDRRRPRQSE